MSTGTNGDDAEGTRQRLAAILAADVAGYSRLMAHDERATVAALHVAREAFKNAIRLHRGRVIDMAGDSVLAIFETAAGALNSAIEIQQTLEGLAAGIPADRRMRFRIGVHLGDVLENLDGSVYGQGINIAARLESLALPGGITVSDAVRGSVRDRVAGVYEDLGEQQVKNIADPVRVYRLVPSSATADASASPRFFSAPAARIRLWTWVFPGMVLAVVAVLAIRFSGFDQQRETDRSPLLSVAVLPFVSTNSSEPDQAVNAFTQGLSSGLAQTVLGRAVISTDAVSAYRSGLTDPRAVGRDLNVRYVVTGDIQRENYQLLVSARLIDTRTGVQQWATQIQTTRHESAELAAHRLLNAVLPALYKAEADRLPSRPARNAGALELVFRAQHKRSSGSESDNLKAAAELCDGAIRLDPALPAALWCKAGVINQWIVSTDPDDHGNLSKRIADMEAVTRKMVQLDPNFAPFWNTRADALRWQHSGKSEAEARSMAMRFAPFLAETLRGVSLKWLYDGEALLSQIYLEEEINNNPHSLGDVGFLHAICYVYLLQGEYGKAISACEKAASQGHDDDYETPMFLAAAYAEQGDTIRARLMRDRAISALPRLTIARWKSECAKYSDSARYLDLQERYLLPGMRKAGFPES